MYILCSYASLGRAPVLILLSCVQCVEQGLCGRSCLFIVRLLPHVGITQKQNENYTQWTQLQWDCLRQVNHLSVARVCVDDGCLKSLKVCTAKVFVQYGVSEVVSIASFSLLHVSNFQAVLTVQVFFTALSASVKAVLYA